MRTNIEIDNALMQRARELGGLPTKRVVVEEALRLLIKQYEQVQVRQLRGKLRWEGNLDEMRQGRSSPSAP